MEKETDFFSLKYGVAGVCVMLTLMVILKVGEILFKMQVRKSESSEETLKANTEALRDMTFALKNVDQRLILAEAILKKLDLDLRRAFAAIRLTAGDKWTAISEQIQKDLMP